MIRDQTIQQSSKIRPLISMEFYSVVFPRQRLRICDGPVFQKGKNKSCMKSLRHIPFNSQFNSQLRIQMRARVHHGSIFESFSLHRHLLTEARSMSKISIWKIMDYDEEPISLIERRFLENTERKALLCLKHFKRQLKRINITLVNDQYSISKAIHLCK